MSTTISRPSLRHTSALLALAVVTTLAACNPSGGSDGGGPSQTAVLSPGEGTDAPIDQLTWAGTGPIRSFDPARGFDGTTWSSIQVVLEPLVTMESDGTVAPALATKWEQVEPTRVELTLRDDVTFWDGQPMTAEDVVFSLERLVDPQVAAENASYFSNMASVRATSDSSVEITLDVPQPEFVSYLALAMVMQKEHSEAAGDDVGSPTELVMGTGAFQVTEYSPASGATFQRNDSYWGPAPTVERIEHKVIPDTQALKLALQSGEVDGTFQVPHGDSSSWDAMENVDIGYASGAGSFFFVLDTTKPPFDDIHARRAFAGIVDQQGIIQAVFNGRASDNKSIVSPLLWANFATEGQVEEFYEALPSLDIGIEQARAELEKSDTPDGFEVSVMVPSDSNPSFTPIAQAVKESARQIGIDITVERAPGGQWLEKLGSEDRDPLGVFGFAPLSSTPLSLPLSLISTDSATSPWSEYQAPEVTEAFEQYQASTDQDDQRAAAESIVSSLTEDVPFVPIATLDSPIALSDEFVYAADFSTWNAYGGINWAANVRAAE